MIKNYDLSYLFRYTSIRLKLYKIDNVSINIYIRLCDCLLIELIMNVRSQIEARNLALDNINLAIEYILGVEALFKSINLQTKDKPNQTELFNASRLGCYICDNFTDTLEARKKELERLLH